MKPVGRLFHFTSTGLFCPAQNFFIDPSRKVPVAVISHAHGDHALPGHELIYTTRATRLLMEERFGPKLRADFREVEFGRPFFLGDVKITFFPAGHILGSAQILFEFDGERYLYTGDFKVQHDPTCEKFHPVACDYLITETTFAHPDYSHPSPLDELSNLLNTKSHLVIGAYAVGKAQRITRLIHELAPDRCIHVHPLISGYHRVYEENGVKLGNWQPYSRSRFLEDTSNVLLLPPSVFSRYDRHYGAKKVFATGWKQSFYKCDHVLTISDHADWNDLINVIENCGAHTIFTLHGDGTSVKDKFSGTGKVIEMLEGPR